MQGTAVETAVCIHTATSVPHPSANIQI